MARDSKLRENELLVLCSILQLGESAYGVTIKKQIEDKSGIQVSTASIYLLLNRLESAGLLKSVMGSATAERGGRRKTYYRVTAKGKRQAREAIASWITMVVPIAKEWELL